MPKILSDFFSPDSLPISPAGPVNAVPTIAEVFPSTPAGPINAVPSATEAFSSTPASPINAVPSAAEVFSSEHASSQIAAPLESPQTIKFTVAKGGTLWGGIEAELNRQVLFEGVEKTGQRTYMIDALKDKFAAMSSDELKAIGFKSGNINLIHPGDTIDLTKVLGDAKLLSNVYSQAGMLSPEQISSIENYKGISSSAEALVSSDKLPVEATYDVQGEKEAREYQQASTEALNRDNLEAAEQRIIAENLKAAALQEQMQQKELQVIASAKLEVNTDINKLFGSKGIWGFGAEHGLDSINWKNTEVGFANQLVSKVLATNAFPPAIDGATQFGIENYSATTKMQEYLLAIKNQVGNLPRSTETVAEYLKRATEILIHRRINLE